MSGAPAADGGVPGLGRQPAVHRRDRHGARHHRHRAGHRGGRRGDGREEQEAEPREELGHGVSESSVLSG